MAMIKEEEPRYDLNRIPERIRGTFENFLRQRAVVREFYLVLTDDQFRTGIGQGDSPQNELVHQIENTRVRIEAFAMGKLVDWSYKTNHNSEHEELLQMDRHSLIRALDDTTTKLYTTYTDVLSDVHLVIMPGRSALGRNYLEEIVQHETGHAFFTVQFCNYFGISRLPAMTQAWRI